MWFGRFVKLVLIALALFAALIFVAGQFLGPGVGDFSDPIVNGYEYTYAGGYERMIVYTGDEVPRGIVIDSRVDEYKVADNKLIVARRPRETYRAQDNVLDSRLLPTCEYWVIDVKTHRVQKTNDSHGLRCS